MGAPFGGEGDFAEAFGAFACGGGGGNRGGAGAFDEGVNGLDDEEEDGGGDHYEGDEGVGEGAISEDAAVDGEGEVREVGAAWDAYKGCNEVFDEGGNYGAKGYAEDDGHGEVNYIPTEEEFFEFVQHFHGRAPKKVRL